MARGQLGGLPVARVVVVLVAAVIVVVPMGSAAAERAELERLVGAEAAELLLGTLAEVEPPERVVELARWAAWQRERGGGFHGLLPAPLEGVEIPVPADDAGRLEAALVVARAHLESREAIVAAMRYPFAMAGGPVPEGPSTATGRLVLDLTAVTGFVDAMSDGRIDPDEARRLAALDSNREMLRHRRELGYVPEPLPTVELLAGMIERAGSPDPLARLWCWISPLNLFGYADLASQRQEWSEFVTRLEAGRGRIVATVLGRISPYLPAGVEVDDRFALTVGCLIRGWATADMAGLNVEQVKDDWSLLLRTMTEEVFHRVQLRLVPSAGGASATFEDLEPDTGDRAIDAFARAALYVALEGSANLVAGPADGVDDPGRAAAGAALLDRFIAEVVDGGDTGVADRLLSEGLRANGPFYAVGYRLAATVAEGDGPRAIGELLGRGPEALLLRGAALAADAGEPVLSPRAVTLLDRLRDVASDGRSPGGRCLEKEAS